MFVLGVSRELARRLVRSLPSWQSKIGDICETLKDRGFKPSDLCCPQPRPLVDLGLEAVAEIRNSFCWAFAQGAQPHRGCAPSTVLPNSFPSIAALCLLLLKPCDKGLRLQSCVEAVKAQTESGLIHVES